MKCVGLMSHLFELGTILLSLATLSILLSLALALLWRLNPTIPGPRDWMIASFLSSIAIFLYIWRDTLPFFLGVVAANAALMASPIAQYFGMCRFLARRINFILPVAVMVLCLVPMFWLTDMDNDLRGRMVTSSIGQGLLLLMPASVLWWRASPGMTARRLMAALYIFSSVGFFLRVGGLLLLPPPVDYLMAGSITAYHAFGSLILKAALALNMVIMVTERQRDIMLANVDEIQGAHRQAEKALKAERVAMQTQRHFLAMVSHEFRTPLAIIDTNAQNMTMDFPEEMGREAGAIRRAVKRMLGLVETCLADEWLTSASTTASLKRQPIELGILLVKMCQEQAIASRRQDIRFHGAGVAVIVDGDPNLLPLIFSNLIDNATKYSDTGTHIDISLSEQNFEAIISFCDEGRGICEADMAYIFDRYFRSPREGQKPGSGLGLYLVKEIVERHGGVVSVSSQQDKGSCFTVRGFCKTQHGWRFRRVSV